MVQFILDLYKLREGIQLLFHHVSKLTIDDDVHHRIGLFIGIAPVETLSDIQFIPFNIN